MHFKIIKVFVLITFVSYHASGQVHKYGENSLDDMVNLERPKSSLIGSYYMNIIYSYQQTKFYASRFSKQLDNGTIELGYGDSYTLRQGWYPFMFDISGFISRYNSTLSQEIIKYRGFEFDLSIMVPRLPRYLLRPYLGIGYQLSQVDDNESFVNTSQSVWKVGITPFKLRLTWFWDMSMYINAEYKQSLEWSLPYSFNQFSIGLVFGIKPNITKYSSPSIY